MTPVVHERGLLTGRDAAAPAGRARRRWYLLSHLVVAAWLVAGTGVALAHPVVPRARWLLVHTLLLGAASTAVLVWTEHFAQALLHRAHPVGGVRREVRLGLFTAGAGTVVAGVVSGTPALTVVGAVLVTAAVVTHAVTLARMTRGALPGRFAFVLRYYLGAASLLPVGAALGVLLARSDDASAAVEARLRLAHEAVNVLGWLGITIVGTMATLWPTMLRTRLADDAEPAARRAVPLLLAGTVLAAGAALVGPPPTALAGLALYAAGLAGSARPWVTAARRRPPADLPTWSLAAATGWLGVLLAALAVVLATGGTWPVVGDRLAALTPLLAVGWIAQTLLGALGYLVPVLVGGGPRTVRATAAVVERWGPARVTVLNAGLAVAVLPVPGTVRVPAAGLVLAVLVSHVGCLAWAARTGARLRRPPGPGAAASTTTGSTTTGSTTTGSTTTTSTTTTSTTTTSTTTTPGVAGPQRLAGAAAGLAVVVLAVAAGAAADPDGLPGGATTTRPPVAATGHTTTVTVRAEGMRFSPARIEVPAGDRLVVVVHNADEDRHDLVLSNGTRTPRIAGGGTATLDAGLVGGDLDGWCSVVGHRQLGMTLRVHATGLPSAAGSSTDPSATAGAADATMDPMATPAAGFTARDARLDPLPVAAGPQVHRRTLTIREADREVAPGVHQRAWTFDGTVPGPALHGRVGDTFEITLVNGGSIGHSIDFHAGSLAPGPVMRTIQPGESLVYRFTATRSGIWMYHCSTMPMSLHLANGMFGAVVVDPPDAAPVGREYVLVQSETYLGPPGGTADVGKLRAAQPDAVVFNGYPNQYVARPLTAAVGERVRLWVLAAGPNLGTSFHVVGGQFDTVFAEGAYRLRPGGTSAGGAQVLDLGPAAGGFVELALPEAGTYPFVSHRMVDAERGARGAITVTAAPARPAGP